MYTTEVTIVNQKVVHEVEPWEGYTITHKVENTATKYKVLTICFSLNHLYSPYLTFLHYDLTSL